MLSDKERGWSRLVNAAAIGLCSLVGTAFVVGAMSLLIYVHLISLSGHQMVVI